METMIHKNFTQEDNEKVLCLKNLAKERRCLWSIVDDLTRRYNTLQPEKPVYRIEPDIKEKKFVKKFPLIELPYPKLSEKNDIALEKKRIRGGLVDGILEFLSCGIAIIVMIFLFYVMGLNFDIIKLHSEGIIQTLLIYILKIVLILLFLGLVYGVIKWKVIERRGFSQVELKVLKNEEVSKQNQFIKLKNKKIDRTNALIAEQNREIRKKNEVIHAENEKRRKQQVSIVNKQYQERRNKIFQELVTVKKKMDLNGAKMKQLCDQLGLDPVYADEVHLEKIRDYMIMMDVSPIRAVKFLEKENEWKVFMNNNFFQMADKIEKAYKGTSAKIEKYCREVSQDIHFQRAELERNFCEELKNLASETQLNNQKMDQIIQQNKKIIKSTP
ncbi:MAG: hypothetical protein ACI4FV_08305 [Lachnospiraceae bacterium]